MFDLRPSPLRLVRWKCESRGGKTICKKLLAWTENNTINKSRITFINISRQTYRESVTLHYISDDSCDLWFTIYDWRRFFVITIFDLRDFKFHSRIALAAIFSMQPLPNWQKTKEDARQLPHTGKMWLSEGSPWKAFKAGRLEKSCWLTSFKRLRAT